MRDEFVHGASYFSALSVDEIINAYAVAQTNQKEHLTKDVEKRALLSCLMTDGPYCFAFDKQYGHSNLLYTGELDDGLWVRDTSEFGNLWLASKKHSDNLMTQHLDLSNDQDNYEIGLQVIQKQYTFILKFFMYDAVSKEFDYPIAKSFSKIYSSTVELGVSFPRQVMLSQKRPAHEVRIDYIRE